MQTLTLRRSPGWELFRDREGNSIPSLLPEFQFSIHSITRSYDRTSGIQCRPRAYRRPDCTLSRLASRPAGDPVDSDLLHYER